MSFSPDAAKPSVSGLGDSAVSTSALFHVRE